MQQLIVELELWTRPWRHDSPLEGKDVAARCREETGLPADVVLGLSFVADEQDVEELARDLSNGDVELTDFERFCQERQLAADPTVPRSAAEFLASNRGQAVAWLHLPAELAGLEMARTLASWARNNDMRVHDGADTFEPLRDEQVHSLWHGAA